MKITEDHFTRIKNDINGNPRYYLPIYLTTEERARAAGAVLYRGKLWGRGWLFQSYNLERDCAILNGEEIAK